MMRRPHVLLITADELNREVLSCYGARSHATPNVDRLAAQGMLFERAYSPSPWGNIVFESICPASRGVMGLLQVHIGQDRVTG